MSPFYDDCGHCPICGKWCAHIEGTISEEKGLTKVEGICKTHGRVDLSNQSWDIDSFDLGGVDE